MEKSLNRLKAEAKLEMLTFERMGARAFQECVKHDAREDVNFTKKVEHYSYPHFYKALQAWSKGWRQAALTLPVLAPREVRA